MANSSVCWFPDGQTNGKSVSPQFVPCDPSAAQSPCCAYGETCTGNGLCLSENGLIYRGGCTDSTFKSSACPRNCIASTGDFTGNQHEFNFLKPCSGEKGVSWVCGLAGDCSNSSKTFGMLVGNPTAWKITGNLSDSISTVSSTTTIPTYTSVPSSTSSAASSNPSCSSQSATVGAAVGFSLGILLLLLSIFFLWQRRKGKKMYEEVRKEVISWQEVAGRQAGEMKEWEESHARDLQGWQDSMEVWKIKALANTHEVPAGSVGSELGDRGPRELAG